LRSAIHIDLEGKIEVRGTAQTPRRRDH
jgi:hypothetical protein